MNRYAAGVEYVGTDFSGWQALSGLRTAQSVLEHRERLDDRG